MQAERHLFARTLCSELPCRVLHKHHAGRNLSCLAYAVQKFAFLRLAQNITSSCFAYAVQNVTLGGTGKETGDRHPKIGNNVLIGASATVSTLR
jgi:hypothetical protein